MITNTFKANSLAHLQETLSTASITNTLIFAFASTDIDHFALYQLLTNKGYTPVTSSSGGQFVEGELLYGGIVCMVMLLPEDSYKVFRYDYVDDFIDAGRALGSFAKNAFNQADALIFANSYATIDHEAIIDGFAQASENRVGLFGGLASNSASATDNYIGIAGAVTLYSVGVVVFDRSKIALQGLVVGGWEPVGTYKTVTKSAGKKVYELDNKPVKEVYSDYFNYNHESLKSRYLEFPIQVSRADGGNLLRTVVDIEDGGFCYSGHIPEGAKIYFCSPSINKAVSSSIHEINGFQENNQQMDCDAVLAFSCSARLHSFGFYIQNELRSFNEMWGAKHAGFFSHGEIGKLHGQSTLPEQSALHNHSVSVVFFKDLTMPHSAHSNSHHIDYCEQQFSVDNFVDKDAVIVKLQEQKIALTSLLQRTSSDLNSTLHELEQYKSGLEQKVNAQLKDIRELNQDIIDTQKEVIFTMGAIAETRSKETGNHVIRVAEYSKVFALQLGLGAQAAELIKQASPMHDIGKVGIPDAILHKPGRLTTEEFKIMKTHAELGYTMLNHSKRPILVLAATIAHEHHERWDGTGYPRGLAGEEINLYGRITAIADVFDALGSERCYKKAWDDKVIWAHLKEQRGKHFDPQLIDIFFEHLDVFKAIRETYRDL